MAARDWTYDNDDAEPEERDVAAYAAEFVGTFLLVFFVCTIVILHSAQGLGVTDWAVIGLVHAFLLAMLVYTLGGGSGAHFNPAVTIALTAIRRARPVDAAVYVLVQLAGGVAGALVARVILSDEGKEPVNYGVTKVSEQFLQGENLPGLILEVIATFVLMFAIMGTAVHLRARLEQWTGLVVGMTLGFAVMAIGPLTGGALNPARWFGPAIVSGEFGDAIVYIAGPLIGALLAAFVYRYLIILPHSRMAAGTPPPTGGRDVGAPGRDVGAP